jgi:uncharacterized protein (DUF362 family)
MNKNTINRRDFVKTALAGTLALAAGMYPFTNQAVVGVARIHNGNVKKAVQEALNLIGGPEKLFENKNQVMLKPNLVAPFSRCTTKPEIIRALAEIIKNEGKRVSIGEGSAAAPGFNFKENIQYRTKKVKILDSMQQYVFDQLGYTKLAEELDIPLINLHSGEMVDVDVPDGLLFDKITVHKSIADTDLLVSVPMMKTHVLATVSLGMKNILGVYPGSVYYSVRSFLHDIADERGSPGTAYEIIDMVRASKMGLTVIDASSAMEGNGPTEGELVDMNLIIAGTNPLATDMVGASIMGFNIREIPTFEWAIKSGFKPVGLDEIEIRGEEINNILLTFKKPEVIPWQDINKFWGVEEI